MNAREAIRCNLAMSNMITQSYLGDLTDQELLVRPVPGANHIAWQLGHLLSEEHEMVESVCPNSMPALPAGFAQKYTKETARLDSPADFHSKSVYMGALEEQRSGTLKALERLTDPDLDKPVPEKYREYIKNVGELFSLQGTHWVMHAGQWAIIRRKLGRAPLF
jgi:DinB superfamily